MQSITAKQDHMKLCLQELARLQEAQPVKAYVSPRLQAMADRANSQAPRGWRIAETAHN